MRIGGVQWTSVIDYPERLATTIFTTGCNMRCPFCQNRSLVLPEEYPAAEPFATEVILARLKKRKPYISAIVITGGEPTIQKDLPDFCRTLKALKFAIKLDTNGSAPELLSTLLEEQLVDYVAMDYKAPLSKYPQITGSNINTTTIEKSLRLLTDQELAIPIEFRTTIVPPLIDLTDLSLIAHDLKHREAKRYYLQQYQCPSQGILIPTTKIVPYPDHILLDFAQKTVVPLFTYSKVRGTR